jgi:thymidylate synthase
MIHDLQYIKLIETILRDGETKTDRTGTGTRSIFGYQMVFDLREGFPILTIKETRYKTAFLEMLWFLSGNHNISWLNERGSKLWDPWAGPDGSIVGYGQMWREWPQYSLHSIRPDAAVFESSSVVDQVRVVIDSIKTNPDSRRHIVEGWDPSRLGDYSLPPCHKMHQLYCTNDNQLDLQVYVRSNDIGLGAPFNIAQYALLLSLYAQCTGRTPRKLIYTIGDAHIYENHIPQLSAWLQTYKPVECTPRLVISNPTTDIDSFQMSDFTITGYECNPFLKLPIAV